MKIKIDNPVTIKVMDISTGHITKQDGTMLTDHYLDIKGENCPIIYDYAEGAFVFCGDKNSINYKSFSCEFNAILKFANEKGYTFVRFDADGEIYPDVKQFDW